MRGMTTKRILGFLVAMLPIALMLVAKAHGADSGTPLDQPATTMGAVIMGPLAYTGIGAGAIGYLYQLASGREAFHHSSLTFGGSVIGGVAAHNFPALGGTFGTAAAATIHLLPVAHKVATFLVC